MAFKTDVENHQEVSMCYKPGLQALGAYSSKVKPSKSEKTEGSVFLERCLQRNYRDAPLWDYMIGYDSEVYFVEIHPASTSNVKEMIKKVQWLKKWLKENGHNFLKKQTPYRPYRWVATSRVAIAKNSRQAKDIARNGLSFPQKTTCLP